MPELGWAIAEANPDLAELLALPAGINVAVPALESLRRPLTAANPARDEGGGFIEVPGGPSPVPSPSPSPGPAIQFPITIAQGGTEAITSQQALINLGAIAIATKGVPGGVAPLDAGALVPSINLPPYPTLGSLGGVPIAAIGAADGVAPLGADSRVPATNLPTNLAYVDNSQTFTGQKTFNGGLFCSSYTFRSDISHTALIGNAIYFFWLPNAANQKLSDIVKITNGNLQVRHLNDNYASILYTWEFTSSGNFLAPGIVRYGSFSTNPTAATNIVGGVYYNTILGVLLYSGTAGTGTTAWRRFDTNAVVP